MEQSDTCAITASIVAVEGMHRKVYEASHGEGTFAWKTTERWPEILRALLECQQIWKKGEGAYVEDVLAEICHLGCVGVSNDEVCRMPLRDCKPHYSSHDELTPEHVAALLDQGPCVGRIWVCPWYYWFDAANNDDWVYRGCGRDEAAIGESMKLYGKEATSHAVVCLGYRFCETASGGQEMHVLVMDNQEHNGPERWIDVEELRALFTLSVDCLAAT